MGILRQSVIQHVRTANHESNRIRGEELGKLPPRIPVSQIGHCPRQAILEAARYHPDHPLHRDPTHDFDDYVKEVMECGNVWEPQTGLAVAEQWGDKVHWQRHDPMLRVGNENWSGHIDFLVEPCEDFPIGAIIEHKATNPNNFHRKGRLPYQFHIMQVLQYERLARRKLGWGGRIPTYVYYRSWNNWGELAVWDDGHYLAWEGEINGRSKSGEFEMESTFDEMVESIEVYWREQRLPPRYATPIAHKFSCAKVKDGEGYADCRYFGVCWPELSQHGPFDIEEFKV